MAAYVTTVGRRTLLGVALAAAPLRLLAQALPAGRAPIAFEVWRNGQKIGAHSVSFQGDEQDFVVAIDAHMLVKIGFIPVFRYHHQGRETWRGGQFQRLETQTTTNGHVEPLTAQRTAAGVSISGGKVRALTAPAGAHPLTHWNAAVLDGPLFNPQTGALVHDQVARTPDASVKLADGRSVQATRYTLTGQADIVDWYDAGGCWTALRGKAPDGSYIDYRRST